MEMNLLKINQFERKRLTALKKHVDDRFQKHNNAPIHARMTRNAIASSSHPNAKVNLERG